MKRSVNKIYIALREKEKNTVIDLLRGECNDIAKAYLKGMQEAYRDIISIMESSNLIKFKKSPTR